MKTQKIEKFDSKLLDELQPVIKDALTAALQKYGLTIRVGSIKYDDTQFTAKVKVETGDNAEAQFKQYAKLLDYNPDWFGKEFEFKGEVYEVVGVDPDKRKFPIRLRSTLGREFGYTTKGLRLALGDKDTVEAELQRDRQLQLNNARFDFIFTAAEHGMNPKWIDQQLVHTNGQKYKISGLIKRGRKFFVLFSDQSMLDVTTFMWLVKQDINKHLRDLPVAA